MKKPLTRSPELLKTKPPVYAHASVDIATAVVKRFFPLFEDEKFAITLCKLEIQEFIIKTHYTAAL
jgi:hypothetical protein